MSNDNNDQDVIRKIIKNPSEDDSNGYFVVSKKEDKKYEIEFTILDNENGEIPEKLKNLYSDIDHVCNIIRTLKNTSEEIKDGYFQELLSLAQVGLVGEKPHPDIAQLSLELLKDEIILVEGQRIKNEYIKNLGLNAIILGGSSFVFFIVMLQFKILNPYAKYLLVFAGATIGTWISFGARKLKITFEQLSIPEEDMMSPQIRLIYIGISAIIFMLFLNTEILEIGIGGITTAKINKNYELQLLIGIICGLVESKIGLKIYNKAVEVVDDESNSKNKG